MKEDKIEEQPKYVSDKIAIPFIILGVIVSAYCFSAMYGLLSGLYDAVKVLNIH